jgi:potassium efflux system protein
MRPRLRPAFLTILLFAMLAIGAPLAASAQQAAPAPPPAATPARDAADTAKAALDQIELTLERRLSEQELADLRTRLDPVRDALATAQGQVEPRLAEARDRLNQLGPKPADNAPPEAPEARQQRDEQTRAVAELDARVRAIKVQQVRVDQLAERITDRRRQLFTAQLFERSVPIVDPRFWTHLIDALPRFMRSANYLVTDWWDHLAAVVGLGRLAAAALVGLLAAFALTAIYRWLRRHGLYGSPADEPASKLARVISSFRVAGERALVLPILVGVGLLIAENFDLVLPRAEPLVPTAVITAIFIVSLTRGIMQGALAPGAPAYRLIRLPDAYAEAVFSATRAAAWVLAGGLVLLAFARVVVAPIAVTAFITSLTAIGIAAVILWFLRRTMDRPQDGDQAAPDASEPQAWGWTRPALWLGLAVIVIALMAGYVALAAFVASRIAAAVLIAAATVMLLALIDAVIAEWFGPATLRGRSLSVAIGIKPERLDLIGTLLGGMLHVIVLIASAMAVFGPWGFGGAGASLEDAFFGLRFGDLRNLVLSIAGSGAVLAIGFLVLRAVLKWIREQVLPRTGIDAGLQNSIATILGYAGFAMVAGLALRQLGLDLSNVAIIAGALSVGIGFGLQSIVSNFVSGLILLAERPIRVGDSIVVKGEEGYVRKISVRSTEIETFERATVILPNAELISGVVKNWTHSNTLGRVAIPVRVAYDSDPEEVREQMIAAACDNRYIVQDPPPRVFLMRFGDLGLEFELRGVVTNVDYSLTVRSDLQLAILTRFRQRGIIIAPPVQKVQTPPEREPEGDKAEPAGKAKLDGDKA